MIQKKGTGHEYLRKHKRSKQAPSPAPATTTTATTLKTVHSEPNFKSLAQQLTEKSYSLKRLTAVLNKSYPVIHATSTAPEPINFESAYNSDDDDVVVSNDTKPIEALDNADRSSAGPMNLVHKGEEDATAIKNLSAILVPSTTTTAPAHQTSAPKKSVGCNRKYDVSPLPRQTKSTMARAMNQCSINRRRVPLIPVPEKPEIIKNTAIISILENLASSKQSSGEYTYHHQHHRHSLLQSSCPQHGDGSGFSSSSISTSGTGKAKKLPVVSLNQQDQIVQSNITTPTTTTTDFADTITPTPTATATATHRDILSKKLVFTHSLLLTAESQEMLETAVSPPVVTKDRIRNILENQIVTPRRILRSAGLSRRQRPASPSLPLPETSVSPPVHVPSISHNLVCIPTVESLNSEDVVGPPGLGETLLSSATEAAAAATAAMEFNETISNSGGASTPQTPHISSSNILIPTNNASTSSQPMDSNTVAVLLQFPTIPPETQILEEAAPAAAAVLLSVESSEESNHLYHTNIVLSSEKRHVDTTGRQINTHKQRMMASTNRASAFDCNNNSSAITYGGGVGSEDLPGFPVKDDSLFRCGSSRPKSAYLMGLEKRFLESLTTASAAAATAGTAAETAGGQGGRKKTALGTVPKRGATLIGIDDRLQAPVTPVVKIPQQQQQQQYQQQQQQKAIPRQRPSTAPALLSTHHPSPKPNPKTPESTYNRCCSSAKWTNRTLLGASVVSVTSSSGRVRPSSTTGRKTPQPPRTASPATIIAHSDGWNTGYNSDDIADYEDLAVDAGEGNQLGSGGYQKRRRVPPSHGAIIIHRSAENPHLHHSHHHHQRHHNHHHSLQQDDYETYRKEYMESRRDHDLAIQEYLDTLLHIQNINAATATATTTTTATTNNASASTSNDQDLQKKKPKKQKRKRISGKPVSMVMTKSKTNTPKNSMAARQHSVTSTEKTESSSAPSSSSPESDEEESSDADSLDLKYNCVELSGGKEEVGDGLQVGSKTDQKLVVPSWVDMFVCASVVLERRIVLIQRVWREYVVGVKRGRLLDVVVYLQRMFRARRVAQAYQRLRNLQKQRRSLAPSMKRFDALDSAAEIPETGECRRISANAFANIVQLNQTLLHPFADAQESRQITESTTIENEEPQENESSRMMDRRAFNPLRYRVRRFAQRRIQARQRILPNPSETTLTLWKQYFRAKESVDARYTNLRPELVLFATEALFYRLQTYRNDGKLSSSTLSSSSSTSVTNQRKSTVLSQIVSNNTEPRSSTADSLLGAAVDQEYTEEEEQPLNTIISKVFTAKTPPTSAPLQKSSTATAPLLHNKDLPFQTVAPVNRSRRPSATVPTAILEVSPNPNEPYSLQPRPPATAGAESNGDCNNDDHEDSDGSPPLLGNLIKQRQSISAGGSRRRTSVGFCLQHITDVPPPTNDQELVVAAAQQKIGEKEVMMGRGSVISRRDDVVKKIKTWKEEQSAAAAAGASENPKSTTTASSSAPTSRPSTAGSKRESTSKTKRGEISKTAKAEPPLGECINPPKTQKKISQTLKKKVAMREARVRDTLEQLSTKISVELALQFVVRTDVELTLWRKRSKKNK
ncbi:hypothetical protein BDR26DRAFT_857300 [Obelidium mucronatum]|nr:hypothetical protein BDR26DRAFT_857300 [Obelidium mucronatum]